MRADRIEAIEDNVDLAEVGAKVYYSQRIGRDRHVSSSHINITTSSYAYVWTLHPQRARRDCTLLVAVSKLLSAVILYSIRIC